MPEANEAYIVYVIDVSVCLCGCVSSNFFFKLLLLLQFFSLILTKFGTHDLHANAHKTVEQIFDILI